MDVGSASTAQEMVEFVNSSGLGSIGAANVWRNIALDKCGIKALPMASTLRNLHGRTDVVDLIVNQVTVGLK